MTSNKCFEPKTKTYTHSIERICQQMTKRSLFSQFRTSLISMLLVLLLTIVGCYWMVISQWNQQNQAKVDTALKETVDRLTRETERMSGIGTAISNSTDIYRFMAGSRETRMELRDSIRFLLTTGLNMDDNISHAYLITHDHSHMTAYPDLRQDASAQIANAIYQQYFMQSPQLSAPFRGVRILPHIRHGRQLYYAVMTPIYPSPSQTADTEYLGALVLLCKVDELDDILHERTGVSTLISCGEEVLACSDENLLRLWQGGQHEALRSQNLRNIAWTVWVGGSEDGAQVASFRKICFIFALCATAVFSLLMLILYQKVVDPIRELEKQSIAVSTADADAITCRSNLLELDSLAQSLNRMLHSQREMAGEVLRLKTDTYESRILFLQSQINPHFLYNNFEMLRGMAGSGMMQELREATSSSAAIYRYCCRSSPEVRLQEEFQCMEQYARLIRLCYRSAYRCMLEYESSTADVVVPRMLLQPLVENAVLHGFIDHHRKTGTVYVQAVQQEERLELTVSDDGGGLTDERLRQLNENQGLSAESKASHIGIQNVARRLHLLYGDAVSLHFSRSESGGLTIRILFHKPEKRTSPSEKTIRLGDFR